MEVNTIGRVSQLGSKAERCVVNIEFTDPIYVAHEALDSGVEFVERFAGTEDWCCTG